jgi:hypothetical protein
MSVDIKTTPVLYCKTEGYDNGVMNDHELQTNWHEGGGSQWPTLMYL